MITSKLPSGSSIMTVMTRAVIKASRGLLRDFSELEQLQVSIKSNRDFVTSADLKADKLLRDELLRARPSYSLISEEGEEVIGEDPSYRWIVDPLDGTVNYMHGFPHWAISIALEKDKEIIAAVTYDPIKNELFWAEKGSGAYVNDKKIRVAGKRSLSDLLISVRSLTDEEMKKFASVSASVRRSGCTTLNMAYLACGRFDLVYSSDNPNIWDVAAGSLLIKEAGGVLAEKDGKITTDLKNLSIMTNMYLLQAAVNL